MQDTLIEQSIFQLKYFTKFFEQKYLFKEFTESFITVSNGNFLN